MQVYLFDASDDSIDGGTYIFFGETFIEMLEDGSGADFDEGFEDEGGEAGGEAVFLEKALVEEEEGDLLAALFLDLVTVVAHPSKHNVSLRFEDKVGPLHELSPNHPFQLCTAVAT